MFNVDGTEITLSRGDTGAIRITAEGYSFGENDRAVFTVKNGSGIIVKQVAYPMTDNAFTVTFMNADTDAFAAGVYNWDVRYVINPYYDEHNNVIDGDQVLTPNTPMTLNLLTVVGDI